MNSGSLLAWARHDQQPGSITMSADEPEKLVSPPTAGATVADNLAAVGARVGAAAVAAGRDPGAVTLVAVGKKQPREKLAAALAAGHRVFGENRVQEAAGKFPALKSDHPDLVLHQTAGLLLNDPSSWGHPGPVGNVANAEPQKIAAPQFTINCQIEKGEIPDPFGELKPDPNSPDLFPFERRLLAG